MKLSYAVVIWSHVFTKSSLNVCSSIVCGLNNYHFWRADRTAHGGGIAAYVRSDLPCDRKRKLEFNIVESINIEMTRIEYLQCLLLVVHLCNRICTSSYYYLSMLSGIGWDFYVSSFLAHRKVTLGISGKQLPLLEGRPHCPRGRYSCICSIRSAMRQKVQIRI
jgi:hypothetical protein